MVRARFIHYIRDGARGGGRRVLVVVVVVMVVDFFPPVTRVDEGLDGRKNPFLSPERTLP